MDNGAIISALENTYETLLKTNEAMGGNRSIEKSLNFVEKMINDLKAQAQANVAN